MTKGQHVHKTKQNNTTETQKRYRAIQYIIKILTHTSTIMYWCGLKIAHNSAARILQKSCM